MCCLRLGRSLGVGMWVLGLSMSRLLLILWLMVVRSWFNMSALDGS